MSYELPYPDQVTTTFRYELPEGPVVDAMQTDAYGKPKRVAVRVVTIERDERTGFLDVTVKGEKLLKSGKPDKRQTYYEYAHWDVHKAYEAAFRAAHGG